MPETDEPVEGREGGPLRGSRRPCAVATRFRGYLKAYRCDIRGVAVSRPPAPPASREIFRLDFDRGSPFPGPRHSRFHGDLRDLPNVKNVFDFKNAYEGAGKQSVFIVQLARSVRGLLFFMICETGLSSTFLWAL